jgi:acyl-CoA hydrolase
MIGDSMVEASAQSLESVLRALYPGSSVFIGSACSEPQTLVEAMLGHAEHLTGIEVMTGLFGSDVPYLDEAFRETFRLTALMSNRRAAEAIRLGHADYLPSSLYNIDKLLRNGQVRFDLAMVQVSPPDSDGYCSLGVNVGYNRAAISSASKVVAEVNARMPRTCGQTLIHESEFDLMVESDRPLLEVPFHSSPKDRTIGEHVAEFIDSGDTIHIGVGSIGEAIFQALTTHRSLRLHTGSVSDAVVDFAESGALATDLDEEGRGGVVVGQCIGTSTLYEYVDGNRLFWLDDPATTHNPTLLGSHESFVSVNSGLQVDLRGQVNAESLNGRQIAGIGGSIDFAMGARLSPTGISIIALRSATSGGVSRIVPVLDSSVVTIPCSLVDVIVTEHGVADLRGLTLRQREEAIRAIAAPSARDLLTLTRL